MQIRKILVLTGSGLLLVQPAYAMTASLGGLGWALLIIGLAFPAMIAAGVSGVMPALRPGLPRRWLSTLVLTTATWLGSLWLLYSYKHQGPQPETTDWWIMANFYIALGLATVAAVLNALRPARPGAANE